MNPAKVFFYPTQGQSEEQQDRDRYECYAWGVRQTGFDPAQHLEPGEERAAVVPSRSPDERVGTGAVVGAMIGAITARPGNAGGGAVAGAVVGSMLGAASASADAEEARRINYSRNARAANRYERQAADFKRAMSACLEGRGYTVK